MADNRLVAVCLACDEAPRKTVGRYSYHGGWYLYNEGTPEFFTRHDHGYPNCIIFVPEHPELREMNDEVVAARAVSAVLHGPKFNME